MLLYVPYVSDMLQYDVIELDDRLDIIEEIVVNLVINMK